MVDLAADMKKTFRIVPLPTAVAASARKIALTGQPDHQIVIADSPESAPCRHCLRWAEPGEAMILFPYQSISAERPYAESGPIFVHQQPCEQYSAIEDYPADFRKDRAIRGYDVNDNMIAAEVAGDAPEDAIEKMLANPEVAFLQVRSVTRGCFTMKVERA